MRYGTGHGTQDGMENDFEDDSDHGSSNDSQNGLRNEPHDGLEGDSAVGSPDGTKSDSQSDTNNGMAIGSPVGFNGDSQEDSEDGPGDGGVGIPACRGREDDSSVSRCWAGSCRSITGISADRGHTNWVVLPHG